MHMKFAALAGALAVVTAATPAAAIVYDVNITDGVLSAVGFIETDGALGALAQANITDYEFLLNDGFGTFFLDGFSNSGFLYTGGFSATATELSFDFSGGGLALFQNPSPGSGINFICFTGSPLCGGDTNRISITVQNFGGGIAQQGVQVVGFADGAVVPEPATWALMIAGFGMVGGAVRASRRRVAAA